MIEIYLIELQGGLTKIRPWGFHETHEEAEEAAVRLIATGVYDKISVKCVQIEEKHVLIEFLKFLQQRTNIPQYNEKFEAFISKRGTVVWSQKIL